MTLDDDSIFSPKSDIVPQNDDKIIWICSQKGSRPNPGDEFNAGGIHSPGGGGRLRETCEGLDKGNRGASVPNKRPVGVKRIREKFGDT